MEVEKQYYSTKEVQTILGVSRTTANQIMHEFERAGHLFRHGTTLRVEIKAFKEWLRQHTAAPERKKSGG